MNVLLDANVWISAFLNPFGHPAQLRTAWLKNRFVAVVAPALLEEIRTILSQPRLTRKYALFGAEIEQFLELLLVRSLVVFPTGAFKGCRDPRDNFLLETALLGRAEYLVSRDDDLKRDVELMGAMEKEGIRILSVQKFIRHLK